MYVIVRVSGRGRRMYHLIAADGSTPLCGAHIADRHWAIQLLQPGPRRCSKCAKCAQQRRLEALHV